MRYAIYYMPESGTPLGRFGCSVLGYDAEDGRELALPQHRALGPGELARLTDTPRKYGFHATLKAPFSLIDGVGEQELVHAVREFCCTQRACPMPELGVRGIGSFLALAFSMPANAVDQLAADCVRAFDRFRAPPTEEERARRLAGGLTEAQIMLFERWGYPYVFGEFRFHMTLTGAVAPDQRERIGSVLSDLLAKAEQPRSLGAITIAKQEDRASRFRVLTRVPLEGRN